VPWEDFLARADGDITDIWTKHAAALPPRLRSHVSNISLLRKSAEDARKDAKLWASRSEGDDTVDMEFPLDEGNHAEESSTTAEHKQNYTALLHILQNAVAGSAATRRSPVLQALLRDLRHENPAEEQWSFVQRPRDFYDQICRSQKSSLFQYPALSYEDVQAAAKAQGMLHLRMLDEIESGPQSAPGTMGTEDLDDILVRHCDADVPIPTRCLGLVNHGPRMAVDVNHTTGFSEVGRAAALSFTLNPLQTMALQLVCKFLDRYAADPDSAGQHLQYTGGPGGTGKSRVIDALKWVFSTKGQSHLLQITGTSGSAAAQIGGTTLHSACGLDTHRSSQAQLPIFSEAKKWTWKQKLVLVVDEVSMLGGATLYEVSRNLQSLRDSADEPFGGIPVVLLMGDFYQFAPVRETSLLVNKMIDPSAALLGQGIISHHRGFGLWQMFKTVVLLEEQVRARDDPRLGALLDRVRAGAQTHQDLLMLNSKLVRRDQVSSSTGLRAITPLNRNRWSLNMEAVVDWARSHKKHISIFISAHTWRGGSLSEDQMARTIELGDDSSCKVPGVFFYAQDMPVVVNQNIYTGLKIVNGAEFTTYDFAPDPRYPGFHLADDVTIHFGPPLGILLHSKDTKSLSIPTLPPGTVLVRSVSQTLDPTNRNYRFLPAKCARRGLPVVPAFVLTDYKAQSKTFAEVLLELRGNRVINGEPSKCDFTSLYVQLSRCRTLDGIKLLSPVRSQDFIGNKMDHSIVEAMQRLSDLAAETKCAYERPDTGQ
jgi:hypothetical protein